MAWGFCSVVHVQAGFGHPSASVAFPMHSMYVYYIYTYNVPVYVCNVISCHMAWGFCSVVHVQADLGHPSVSVASPIAVATSLFYFTATMVLCGNEYECFSSKTVTTPGFASSYSRDCRHAGSMHLPMQQWSLVGLTISLVVPEVVYSYQFSQFV